MDLLRRLEKERGVRIVPDTPDDQKERASRPKPLTAKEFTRFQEQLTKRYDDETLAYHLARLGNELGPVYREVILELPDWVLVIVLEWLHPEADCWKMTGEMSVGVVFVESSRSGGPTFSTAERSDICNEIIAGLNWLSAAHPGRNLRWVYDFQFISIDVADGDDQSDEAYWRDPAMSQVSYHQNTYPGTWGAVAEYREDMRLRNNSEHAITVFATPYGTEWHAYASGSRLTLARRNNWGNWGLGALDRITSHEVCHLFGAADEYTGSGTPCNTCNSLHGCDQVRNGNCGACADSREDCVMDANAGRLCSWTRGQIGWSHLFVELTTADDAWAGTDDDVVLDIGERTFVLDNTGVDDRERGDVQGYALWVPDLDREEIKRILIRKGADGFSGGWKLARIRVWFRGDLICDRSPNRWLEDETLTWAGCTIDNDWVNTLRVRISTADVGWAGTDDDVTIRLAGRTWTLDNSWHNDFERGNTDTFDLDPGTGLRRSAISSVRIHKSQDGWGGGWKLKGVQVIANGSTLYDNQSINRWLEDSDRTWVGSL